MQTCEKSSTVSKARTAFHQISLSLIPLLRALTSRALASLGENRAYDTEFFSLLAQKRNSEVPLIPFIVFNLLASVLCRSETSVLDSFFVGFDFVPKDGLILLNPVALVNCGRLGSFSRLY